jgi:plastocyanin
MRERLIMAFALILVSGCSKKDSPTEPVTPGTTILDVYTPGLVFSPAYFTISVGTTVRFNITGVAHDVTFQAVPGAPQSIPVTQNQVVSRTFNTKGVFPFDCFTHPGMIGSVTVQ